MASCKNVLYHVIKHASDRISPPKKEKSLLLVTSLIPPHYPGTQNTSNIKLFYPLQTNQAYHTNPQQTTLPKLFLNSYHPNLTPFLTFFFFFFFAAFEPG